MFQAVLYIGNQCLPAIYENVKDLSGMLEGTLLPTVSARLPTIEVLGHFDYAGASPWVSVFQGHVFFEIGIAVSALGDDKPIRNKGLVHTILVS
jgi:hypothetical protein